MTIWHVVLPKRLVALVTRLGSATWRLLDSWQTNCKNELKNREGGGAMLKSPMVLILGPAYNLKQTPMVKGN